MSRMVRDHPVLQGQIGGLYSHDEKARKAKTPAKEAEKQKTLIITVQHVKKVIFGI